MNLRSLAIVRSVAVIGGTAALIGGVTFAALTSNTVTLSDNTIATASADLQIWNGTSFGAGPIPGFNITGLVPGTPSTALPFYLKNSGGVDLAVTAHVPVAPTLTGVAANKVHILINNTATGGGTVDTTLDALETGQVAIPGTLHVGDTGNSGSAGHAGNYTYSVSIGEADVTGPSASVSNFGLEVTGTQTP